MLKSLLLGFLSASIAQGGAVRVRVLIGEDLGDLAVDISDHCLDLCSSNFYAEAVLLASGEFSFVKYSVHTHQLSLTMVFTFFEFTNIMSL